MDTKYILERIHISNPLRTALLIPPIFTETAKRLFQEWETKTMKMFIRIAVILIIVHAVILLIGLLVYLSYKYNCDFSNLYIYIIMGFVAGMMSLKR